MRRDRHVGIEMRAHLMVPRDVESCGGGRAWRSDAPYVCVANGVFLSRRRDRLEILRAMKIKAHKNYSQKLRPWIKV